MFLIHANIIMLYERLDYFGFLPIPSLEKHYSENLESLERPLRRRHLSLDSIKSSINKKFGDNLIQMNYEIILESNNLKNNQVGFENHEIIMENNEIGLQNNEIQLENNEIQLENNEIQVDNQEIVPENNEIGLDVHERLPENNQILLEQNEIGLEQDKIELLQENVVNPIEEAKVEVIDQKKQEEALLEQSLIQINLIELPFYVLEALEPYQISCPICFKNSPDFKSFECADAYCTDCILLLLNNYIDTSYVFPDEILCPVCSKSISDDFIKDFVSAETYNKMLSLRESLKIQKLVAENKAIYCPMPGCGGFGHVLEFEDITACSKCRGSLCNKCKSPVHPGLSCEESKLLKPDVDIDDYIFSQSWKKCPTCGIAVEKVDGCQFVVCYSPLCKGKNALCYLCGRFVIEDQHFSHYERLGPFGDSCNTLDGIPEVVDRSLMVPIIDHEAPYNPRAGEEE
jgi:IBR domain, a half RING-finger domain